MKPEKPKALLAFSGGLDSTVLLAKILPGYDVTPILFQYGSKQDAMQFNAVRAICEYYGIGFENVEIPHQVAQSSGMASDSDEAVDTVESSTIPCRNLVFASVLASIAAGRGIRYVFMGLQDGGSSQYRDCHPDFVRLLQETIDFITKDPVDILNPLMFLSKASVAAAGIKLEAPLHLTRTCYTGNDIACGKCVSCQKRLQAFKYIVQVDPIEYENGNSEFE